MDWDWNSITTGEWWVAVIALLALAIGLGLGYALGARAERRRDLGYREGPRPPAGGYGV